MKLFCAQINPIVGDIEGNAQKIIDIAERAYKNSADLVLTPELSLWGYPPKDLLLKKYLIKNQTKILNKMAKYIFQKYGELSITVGIAEEIQDSFFPNLYNSIAIISCGKWSVIGRKIILPSYEVFDEKRYFRSADKVSILTKNCGRKDWKIGITICEDLWVNDDIEGRGKHKRNPIEEFKAKKIDFLINFSASPFTIYKQEKREKISNSATNLLKVPLIYINQVGGNDDLVFDGNSFITDENGKIIKRLKSCSEEYIFWDLSKKTIPLETIQLKNEIESIFDTLVLGVKDYAKKCKFSSSLIGLSGGIDSALVAVIATAAMGKNNVFCYSMPSKWNSESSLIDAQDLADKLKINLNKIPIHEIHNSFESVLLESINFQLQGITNENIQSRIRGTILMAIANCNNHLLLSTGNKSELAVGYCTLYGDMNGGLAVIGDLYKTNVFKMCKWLDSNESIKIRKHYGLPLKSEIIGEKILNKPPSAELGPNQFDSDSLPPYSELDQILKGIIEEKKDLNELEKEGYAKKLVLQIISLIKNSEFKRRQAPPILKLSTQSLGSDWRLPIASKNK